MCIFAITLSSSLSDKTGVLDGEVDCAGAGDTAKNIVALEALGRVLCVR